MLGDSAISDQPVILEEMLICVIGHGEEEGMGRKGREEGKKGRIEGRIEESEGGGEGRKGREGTRREEKGNENGIWGK